MNNKITEEYYIQARLKEIEKEKEAERARFEKREKERLEIEKAELENWRQNFSLFKKWLKKEFPNAVIKSPNKNGLTYVNIFDMEFGVPIPSNKNLESEKVKWCILAPSNSTPNRISTKADLGKYILKNREEKESKKWWKIV